MPKKHREHKDSNEEAMLSQELEGKRYNLHDQNRKCEAVQSKTNYSRFAMRHLVETGNKEKTLKDKGSTKHTT